MIGGPSAVGKSTMLVPLIINVTHAVADKYRSDSVLKNYNSQLWCFDQNNEYADAYTGQFNTIIDEAGQCIDTAGNPDFGLLSAIRMINSMNYPMHMANLEDKGTTNFKSEIVWATTNRTHFKLNSLYSSEAYTRRFRVSYLHVPKKQYCTDDTKDDQDLWNRRLDKSKIAPMSEDNPPDMSIHEFWPYNFLLGKVTGPPISYIELQEHIIFSYNDQKAQQDALIKYHHSENLKAYSARWETKNQSANEMTADQLEQIMFENCLNMEDNSEQIQDIWLKRFGNLSITTTKEMSFLEKSWEGFKNFAFRHPYITACLGALTLISFGTIH